MPEFTIGAIEDVIAELEVEFSEIKELTPNTATWSMACTVGGCGGGATSTCATLHCTGADCQTF